MKTNTTQAQTETIESHFDGLVRVQVTHLTRMLKALNVPYTLEQCSNRRYDVAFTAPVAIADVVSATWEQTGFRPVKKVSSIESEIQRIEDDATLRSMVIALWARAEKAEKEGNQKMCGLLCYAADMIIEAGVGIETLCDANGELL